jgi:hypothetical protein
MLSEYISMEIDLEILDMLITDAATTDFWSATPGEDYDGSGTGESNWNITTFYGTTIKLAPPLRVNLWISLETFWTLPNRV